MEIFTDGGSRGNPGKAACAFVVMEGGSIIHKGDQFLEIQTNNYAEYKGVLLALSWLEKNLDKVGDGEINFYLDSELVVRQMNGIYKVKDADLKILFREIQNKIKELKIKVVFKHILREKNKIADFLVNNCLDRET